MLLQIRQRFHAARHEARELIPIDIQIAIAIDVAHRPEQLQRRLDGAREPEHEKDEGPQDDDAGQEQALRDEIDDQEEEEEREARGADLEDEEPGVERRMLDIGILGRWIAMEWVAFCR